MKLVVLAVLLGVATPACAQLARHVIAEQASSEIAGELVPPPYEPELPAALPTRAGLANSGQPKPAFQTRTVSLPLWFHASAFAGSVALDAWSTSRFVNSYRHYAALPVQTRGVCSEGNRSLGLTPTDGHIASYYAAWTGGEVAATYLLKRFTRHFKSRAARESWRLPITYLTAYHSYWGTHNLAVCK